MKYLLIGGAGFLGSRLSRDLIGHDHKVLIYDNFLYTNRTAIPPQAEFIDDCVSNIGKHAHRFKDVDYVYYLAGPRLTDITIDAEVNVELDNLRKALNLFKKCKRLIFTSSCSVYGKDGSEVNEFSATHITSKYSELKIRSEDLIRDYNLPNFRIVRLATLYGDGVVSRPDLMINSFLIDVCTKENITVFDGDSYRPHLYIDDAATLLRVLARLQYDDEVLNIGKRENTLTKIELVNKLNSIFNKNCQPIYDNPVDSRNYQVSFKRLSDLHHHSFADFNSSIKETESILNRMTFSLGPVDKLTQYHLAPTASPTWYIEEENQFGFPKNWGFWNVLNEDFELFDRTMIWSLTTPFNFKDRDVQYKSEKELPQGSKHIHLVPVFDPDYFKKNRRLGLSCVPSRYIGDFCSGDAKLVFMLTLEGYSGSEGNQDLEIIEKWITDYGIPGRNVYYITGNLIGDKRAKRKGVSFNVVPHGEFDNWIPYYHITTNPIEFNPKDDRFLYLSYARNPRHQRIKLCHDLLKEGLLDKGRVSLNTWNHNDEGVYDDMDSNTVLQLHSMTPIEIDRTLDYNLACEITIEDYTSTFISIVNETLTDVGTLFISEKTYKAIAVGHPFIIAGSYGTLEYLKSLGFKTFDKWIDESYDTEPDFKRRMRKLISIIVKLNQLPISELRKIRKEMLEVVQHNQKVYVDLLIEKYDMDPETNYMEYPYKPIAAKLRKIWNDLNET